MAVDLKNNFKGGLDLDTSLLSLSKTSYIDALNITRDAIEGNEDDNLTNIISNRLIDFDYTAVGDIIGAYPFQLRNAIYFFRTGVGGYDGVYEYDRTTDAITKIFECITDSATNILNFDVNKKINNVNVIVTDTGDLLFFLDSLGRPTLINITRFKLGEYTPVTRDIIDVAKNPPLTPPPSIYGNDTTRRSNNLTNKLFRFMYRWVYDDNEKSTPSPIGAMPIPDQILDVTFTNVITNNNVINISLNSGEKDVKAVELLMSYVNKTNVWSPFLSVSTYNKVDNSIADNTIFNFAFYNDGTYSAIDPIEATQLYDYVPDFATCQDFANGNVPVYGGIREGLSRDIEPNVVNTINTVAAGSGGGIGSFSGNNGWFKNENFPFPSYRHYCGFFGVPIIGTVILLSIKKLSDDSLVTVATYTTINGDTASTVAAAIKASAISLSSLSAAGRISDNKPGPGIDFQFSQSLYYNLSVLTITPPAISADDNSIPTFKFSTDKEIAMAYFTKKGKTNGILYHARLTFPAYAENGSEQVLLPYINTKIYHVPPLWADSFQFFFTKEPSSYLYWETPNVLTAETDYLYFDVTNITLNALKNPTTAAVLNYSFADGDRMRLIKNDATGDVYADTYDAAIIGLVVNPLLNSVTPYTGQFLKIKKVAPFDTPDYSTKNFIIEIYRPAQQTANDENKTYYEFGEQYLIGNPHTDDRYHIGQVVNQDIALNIPAEFNFYSGDSYFRLRTIPLTETGVGVFYALDRNVVDFYTSAVSSLDGTPNLIDPNSRETFNPALLRFGQAYQPNTNINGVNRFQFENFLEVDASYGTIMRIKTRQREMHVFQQFKTGNIPIFSQIQKDALNNAVTVVTDKLLNPVQYYSGDWGIGTASESLVSVNYSDYFCDNNKGVILRLSKDGLTPLSIIANINNWASNEVTARTGDYKIYGTFNQKANSCIWALEETEDYPAKTIVFNEDANNFESFLSMHPQTMCCLGTTLVTCFEGNLYTHDGDTYNNFYGVAYPSSVTLVFNDKSMVKKTFNAIGYQSNEKWISNTKGDIYTSNINPQTGLRTQSKLVAADYELQENVTVAAFQRDMNSMSNERVALFEGDYLKGVYIATKLICPSDKANKLVYLNQIYTTNSISQKNF